MSNETEQKKPDPETPVLSVRGISKSYGGTRAVDDISFDVGAGEVLTLLGRSGCGKSTTLRIVAGLERPDAGEIDLRGKVVVAADRGIYVSADKRNIGLVFQSYAVWPHMTVAENIGYPLKIRRHRRAEIRSRVEQICALVGLGALIDRPATQLSGGQQQRVALARALIHEPDLLLLDEPFSNLDTQLREELRLQMKRLQARLGMSVLYVTHDQTEAMDLSHRVAVMYEGRIQQLAGPREIYERPANFFIQRFVGNVLTFDGSVAAREGEQVSIDLGEGVRVSLPCANADLRSGMAVRLTTRPEDIRVESDGCGADFAIPARVNEVSYIGQRQDCKLTTPGGENTVPVSKGSTLAPDDRVALVLDPAKVRIWPWQED